MDHLAATALCELVQTSFAKGLCATEVSRIAGLERSVCIKLRDMNISWHSRFSSELTKLNAVSLKIDMDKAIELVECIPGFGAARHRRLANAYDQFIQGKENSLDACLADIFIKQLFAGLFDAASMYGGTRGKGTLPRRLIKATCEFPTSLITLYRRCLVLEKVVQMNVDSELVAKAAAVATQAFRRESQVINLIRQGANLPFLQRFLPDFHLTPNLYRQWREIYGVDTTHESVDPVLRLRIFAEYEQLISEQPCTVLDAYLTLSRRYGLRIDTLYGAVRSQLSMDKKRYPDTAGLKEVAGAKH